MKSASKIIASLLIHCAILALINLKETWFVVSVYLPTKDFNQVLFEKRRSLEFGEIPLANPCMFVSKSVNHQSRKRKVEAEQMQKRNLCEKSRQFALAAMSRPAHNTVYQVDGTSKPLIKNRSNFGPFEVDKRDLEKV